MAKTTDLSFDGGAIVAPGGETTSAQVHTVFLHEITITDAGQESHIYALFDKNRPTASAPFFEPVSSFNLAEWCIRGDAVQVDLSEVMDSGTDRYSGLLQDLTLSNDQISGMYVRECTLRTMLKHGTTGVRFAWFGLYLIMDQDTSITYLATPVYNNPATLDVPDHKVQVEQTDSPNYLAYKIMGDGSTVNVDIIRENSLGQTIDPFLRISSRQSTDVIKWSDVLAVEDSDYSEFISRIASDIAAGIAPVVLDEDNSRLLVLYDKASASDRFYFIIQNSVQSGTSFIYAISPNEVRIYEDQIIPRLPKGQVSISVPLHMAVVENNTSSAYTYTGSNPLDFLVTHPASDVPNFGITIKSTANADGTVTVYELRNGVYVPLKPSVAGGTTVEAGKTYQLTCVGDCWTLAEFEEPSVGLKTKIGGKMYKVVKIGNLYWMAENLDYVWEGLDYPADSTSGTTATANYYDDDSATYGGNGLLYNGIAAETLSSLPALEGWRMPTTNDFIALMTAVGGPATAGTKLKSTSGWDSAGNGTDDYGFNGKPAGGRYNGPTFDRIGKIGGFWALDENAESISRFNLDYDSTLAAITNNVDYSYGFSIRLVKDA